MTVPLKVDLTGKTAAITGGGGVLCGKMAEALGECGAKVAVLDLREGASAEVAKRIVENGGLARSYACDVLDADSLRNVGQQIVTDLGEVDILVNGAGGNHPKGTTTKEFLFPDDLKNASDDLVTFYDLDPAGIQFVFNLNFLGTLLPTQA